MPAWTDTADRTMLLAFIAVLAPTVSGANCQSVADIMGEGYTSESVRQHLAKLRKSAPDVAGATKTASTDGTPTAPKTPKAKRTPRKKAGSEGKTKSATGGKRKAADSVLEEADGDDDEEHSPSKKMKAIKSEELDMD
ncbi:hypothetical protein TI39_contig321g00030 [Zymoseptoria brevis]|uniref:Uncharacterized protein n=1 Tax=Zymoseptoria brevis TaxID=1047168 RepID=A0A0F4GTA2_9PEZI|nr:hypothetical protein TI39_contig321g00030 [Zymoseptoria brevis]